MSEKSKLENKYGIKLIPDDEKAKDYLASNFGMKYTKEIEIYNDKGEKDVSIPALTSHYWTYYKKNYNEFPKEYLKVLFHPDLALNDKRQIDELRNLIPVKIIGSVLGVFGCYFGLYLHKKRKARVNRLNWLLVGFTFLPMTSYLASASFFTKQLDWLCEENNWKQKYRLDELDHDFMKNDSE